MTVEILQAPVPKLGHLFLNVADKQHKPSLTHTFVSAALHFLTKSTAQHSDAGLHGLLPLARFCRAAVALAAIVARPPTSTQLCAPPALRNESTISVEAQPEVEARRLHQAPFH